MLGTVEGYLEYTVGGGGGEGDILDTVGEYLEYCGGYSVL